MFESFSQDKFGNTVAGETHIPTRVDACVAASSAVLCSALVQHMHVVDLAQQSRPV